MLGIGWAELVVVVIIAILVAGPKQIPDILYWVGRLMRRMRYLQHTVMTRIDDHLDLEDVRRARDPSPVPIRSTIEDEQSADAPVPVQDRRP